MTEFEVASAKYQKARDAYWRAQSDLATAKAELAAAEHERNVAFNKEFEGARAHSFFSSGIRKGGA